MKLIIILLIYLFSSFVFAQEERWIDIEWDAIENAQSYEIELLQNVNNENKSLGIFKTELPTWSKSVTSGIYSIKLRALDKRGVPGDWSQPLPISIKSKPPELEYPRFDQLIEVEPSEYYIQEFHWKSIPGINLYKLQVFDTDNKLVFTEVITNNTFSYKFKFPGQYYWNVAPLLSKNDEVELNLKKYPFKISFGQLKAPELTITTSSKTVLFNWNKINRAEQYLFELFKEKEDGSFEKLENININSQSLSFPKSKFEKGTFKAIITAKGSGFIDSNSTELVYEYDKEEIKVLIDNSTGVSPEEIRKNQKKEIESYFSLPSMSYQFKNYETDTVGNQNLSGTALDLTFKLKIFPENFDRKYKFLTNLNVMSMADLYASSIFLKLNNSLEFFILNKYASFYGHAGIFIEKTPAFIISRLDTSNPSIKNYLILGPSIGLKEEYAFKNDYLFFANQNFYLNALQVTTLSGNESMMSFSFDLDLGIKYFFKKNLDLNAKATYKYLGISSKAYVGNSSYANSGDQNSLVLDGLIWSAGFSWYF